jgi:hypothetical protein
LIGWAAVAAVYWLFKCFLKHPALEPLGADQEAWMLRDRPEYSFYGYTQGTL